MKRISSEVPFRKAAKKRFADFRKEIEWGEIKWTNKKKNLKKYSECLTKHLRLRQRIVFKIKHSKTISSFGKFPKGRVVHSRRFTHQSQALQKSPKIVWFQTFVTKKSTKRQTFSVFKKIRCEKVLLSCSFLVFILRLFLRQQILPERFHILIQNNPFFHFPDLRIHFLISVPENRDFNICRYKFRRKRLKKNECADRYSTPRLEQNILLSTGRFLFLTFLKNSLAVRFLDIYLCYNMGSMGEMVRKDVMKWRKRKPCLTLTGFRLWKKCRIFSKKTTGRRRNLYRAGACQCRFSRKRIARSRYGKGDAGAWSRCLVGIFW